MSAARFARQPETAPYSGNKVARCYLGRTRTERVVMQLKLNPTLGRPEHDEDRWVSVEEAVALLPARLQHAIAWAAAKIAIDTRSNAR